MNTLSVNNSETISSLDFLQTINQFRQEAGQSPIEPRKFIDKIEDELDDLCGKKFRLNINQSKSPYYDLNRDQMMLVGMRESKAVRKKVQAYLKSLEQPAKPMTTLEMIAGMASSMVEVERQQAQQAQALVNLSTEVAEIKESNMIWDKRPNNAEGITAIKRRINDKHGIPAWAIEEALRSAYGPRPAGSVRNSHESANGSTYVVYWISDVTRMFERIAKEAEHVTATLATHSMISKRFKLV
jgi:hypothetical protein